MHVSSLTNVHIRLAGLVQLLAFYLARLETVFKVDLRPADGRIVEQPTMHSVQAGDMFLNFFQSTITDQAGSRSVSTSM